MNHPVPSCSVWPSQRITNGTLEALKWFALLLMLGDHINKYLLNGTESWLYDAGRLAMPLFVFVLAFNLARPDSLLKGAYGRTMLRLGITGVAATPAFLSLGGLVYDWWPLNILFTLLVLALILYLIERATPQSCVTAGLIFVVGGSLVEYWWPALIFGIAIWSYCRSQSIIALVLAVSACASLSYINGNHWALASLVILILAIYIDFPFPRLRWVFYAFYPTHLYIIWIMRVKMSTLGYLFFV